MSRTQRAVVMPVTLILILLAAAIGTFLGTMPAHKWDTLLAQLQNNHIVAVPPASQVRGTLYVLDTDRPTAQEVMVDVYLPQREHDYGPASLPLLLTPDMGAVEIPLDDGLALRMECVPILPYPDHKLEPIPATYPVESAYR